MQKSRLLAAVGIVAVVGCITGVLAAQTPARLAFEVISIKPNTSHPTGGVISHPSTGTLYSVENITPLALIRTAYGNGPRSSLHDEQVIDAPGWLQSDTYDLRATQPAGTTREQQLPMLRNMLAERFALKVHHETRILAASNLVAARSDGSLGPQLQHASDADAACDAPAAGADASGLPPCSESYSFDAAGGAFRARGILLDRFADVLSQSLEASPFVFDKTMMAGRFNITLKWNDRDGPAVVTAIQEQLGLKLENARSPIDVIVIDHVEKPTAN